MRLTAHGTLGEALGLGDHELVALVGGGGKSSALGVLAQESEAAGRRVVVTTTTGMFLAQLTDIGPAVIERDGAALAAGLRRLLTDGWVAAAARALGDHGKVVGLPPAVVDAVWAAGAAERLVVEADGSRGRPLKAFAAHEPQVPSAATTTVLVAGVDAVGRPLTDAHVHRADLLCDVLRSRPGSPLTVAVVACALREQVRVLRRASAARMMVLLNKADDAAAESVAMSLAKELLPECAGRAGGRGTERDRLPDGVVIASLRRRRYLGVSASEE